MRITALPPRLDGILAVGGGGCEAGSFAGLLGVGPGVRSCSWHRVSPGRGLCGDLTLRRMDGRSDADVYRDHAQELTRFATALVGPASAQDVVADAVVRMMKSRVWLEAENRRALLFRAVLFEARSSQRSTARRRIREHAELRAVVPVDENQPRRRRFLPAGGFNQVHRAVDAARPRRLKRNPGDGRNIGVAPLLVVDRREPQIGECIDGLLALLGHNSSG